MPQEKNNINEIPAYSAFLFKLDIQKQLEEEEDEILEETTKENAHSDSFEKDSSIRNKKHQLKVLNFFLNLLVDNVDKKRDVKQIVKLIVTQDEPLFGFAYFVSCNSQFGNTWSYLRKQTIGYQEKLVDLFFFFTNIVKAVNQLQELDAEYKKAEFIFNDLFVLSFNEYARPKMTLEWSKFDHLLHVKDGFTIAVRKDKLMLFSMYCKFVDEEQDDVQQRPILVFIDKLKKIWKGYFHE